MNDTPDRDATRPLSVVLAGGGTAGHVEPALAVADALRQADPDTTVTLLGTERGLETRLVPQRGYDLRLIEPVPVPRKLSVDLLRLPGRVLRAVRQTRDILTEVDADVVIGFGGYVSAPAYLAARRLRRRPAILVHEANARAGLANRLGVRLGGTGLAAVPGSGLKAQVVGMPVRRSLTELDRAELRDTAREFFGLATEGAVLLVTGGSQGARSINEAVAGASSALGDAGIAVLHATGPRNSVDVSRDPLHPPHVTVPYIDRMDLAYSAADLVVCRSGAMTVAEVSAIGLPAVYVPLPHGNGEQALNAQPVVDAGGGVLIADADLTPERLVNAVVPLITSSEALAEMGRAAAGAGHRGAADAIADLVIQAGQRIQSREGARS